jgi:ATP-binding protein involved in chromosome partitioning
MAELNEQGVKDALKQVFYPGVTKDVFVSGVVKKITVEAGGDVHLDVSLPTMVVTQAVRDGVVRAIEAAAVAAGARKVKTDVAMKVVGLPPPADKARLPGVKNVIAVASGKGGVGKSTVAVNLALALKQWGANVGLLDADVFGPSVPQMLGVPERPVGGTSEKRIGPAIYHGMKVISVAFFVEKDQAVVWRGPMVHKLLEQFMTDVEWGDLDYLVIDLPPGTGDVQLSLSQLVPISGAVMVTTPQQVAVIDVIKGIAMFRKVEIPILGVVENMAYYVCPGCGHHDDIFARGGGKALAEREGTELLSEIPIHGRVRHGGDSGMPVILGAPDSEHAKLFTDLAARVAGLLAARVLSGPRRSAALVAIR